MTEADSCLRCKSLTELVTDLQAEVAQLEERTRFVPCGHGGPGSAMVEITMPDGRPARGWLCRPHQVLLSATPFAPRMAVGFMGRSGPCGWLVPAEEALAEDPEADARDDAAALGEVT